MQKSQEKQPWCSVFVRRRQRCAESCRRHTGTSLHKHLHTTMQKFRVREVIYLIFVR